MRSAGASAPHGAAGPLRRPADLAQAFKLHSRPGAKYIFLLDFTGHVTTNVNWNWDYGVDPIITPPVGIPHVQRRRAAGGGGGGSPARPAALRSTAPPPPPPPEQYTQDNDTSNFSNAELAGIIAVWRSVASDYAPFDVRGAGIGVGWGGVGAAPRMPPRLRRGPGGLSPPTTSPLHRLPAHRQVDVTTEEIDPATGKDLVLTGRGHRVVIGGLPTDWFGATATASGVAYMGAFGDDYLQVGAGWGGGGAGGTQGGSQRGGCGACLR